ncbi:hypothetical protein [Fluviicola sp.]|jgi:hypothetical protein|uniref:hypothetical protein n=1 Tax=Fluviicola sp. TaxID=1917219 RepID=UPI00282E9114|nr:hypothetical protein [Fluviicola sp.]MDR0802119.1 hypothetical protein [Fluviicola sp.]
MMHAIRVGLLLLSSIFFCWVHSWTQENAYREKTISATSTLVQLDSLSIAPNSLIVHCGNRIVLPYQYRVDYAKGTFQLYEPCSGELRVSYRVLPFSFGKSYQLRDTNIIYTENKGDRDKFLITPAIEPLDLMGANGLRKSGSISRGVTFGNRQDLSVNSSLNLELSGYLAPNLQVLASVTDNNLPIQPEGNTNKLQEFDQVFIQLFNNQFKLTAGDFWISKPDGYFLTYKKRGQGLTGEYFWKKDKTGTIRTQASGALSKGKFNRQIIQGVEGNQGPYRLTGNENEPYIIILSGTERVYIDGKLMTRGQEFDYIIDYNTSELTFTARNLITKDIRIVVEFQYSDQNYARSLFQFSTTAQSKNLDWWVNAYSEQDAKNQPLQQNLTDSQKKLLSEIGDSLQLARYSVIDSVGYSENLVMYKMIDSLGFDSILVASVQPGLAYYKVQFSYVGPGKGDYVFEKFNAIGRVYKWVEPVGGVSVGNYAPVSLIITPKRQQLFTAGATYRLNNKLKVTSELGMSGYDLNTFSNLDRFDDRGFSMRTRIEHSNLFGKDSVPAWTWQKQAEIEMLDPYFKPIEQYRTVEFDRDWNTRNMNYKGNQVLTTLGTSIENKRYGKIGVNAQQYKIGSDFSGLRTQLMTNWRQNGFSINIDASYLNSKNANSNQFIRHKADISKQIKKVRIGYKDDQEWNSFVQGDSLLSTQSYRFFDYQGYVAIGDTSSGELQLSYRERIDGKSDSVRLKNAAKARTFRVEWTKNNWKNQRLYVVANYRELKIFDTLLINQAPENTTNGRIDHDIKFWKGAVNLTTFYEVGAGLEQKKEFIYIKVNDGQGVYTWIDYNNDGIKDLNEFEIAAYADQASYIRVFTPSNDYIKTYSNEYNQSLMLRPERVWGNKTGVRKMIARFSSQTRFRLQRKTNVFGGARAYNPFVGNIDDNSLISTANTIKTTLYFNRTNNVGGGDYSYENTKTKTLLATGFDGRTKESHEFNVRITILKKFSFQSQFETGLKTSSVDYTTGRNYRLHYWQLKPSFIYQPATALRFSVDGRIIRKKNEQNLGGEAADIYDIGMTGKFNQTQKGSLQGQFNVIRIAFRGDSNTPLGFELLEALKPGVNYVWNLGYQRSLSKNLQISIQYNGRKSEGNKVIHAGGMEVKAFF